MTAFTITGYSDDLIEIDGDVREELNAPDTIFYLGVSDGTLLQVDYTLKGVWKFTVIQTGTGLIRVAPATNTEDDYSDRALFDVDSEWVWVTASPDAARVRL